MKEDKIKFPEEHDLFIAKAINANREKIGNVSSPENIPFDIPVQLSYVDFKSVFNALKSAIEADFTVAPEISPIRPLIETIIDSMLLLIKAIQNGDPMMPVSYDEAGLVDDADFRPATVFNPEGGKSVMPKKLVKIKSLNIRKIEFNAVWDLYTVIEWLISLTSGVTTSLSQFLAEKKFSTLADKKALKHKIVLRNQKINSILTKERKARNRNAARWRKLKKM